MDNIEYKIAGDRGLVISFGDIISEQINQKLLFYANLIKKAVIKGIIEIVPTYRDVFIKYDPIAISVEDLILKIQPIFDKNMDSVNEDKSVRTVEIPVVYGGEHGFDLRYIADQHNISEDEVILEHSSKLYRVYMIGFSPGLAYLGGLSKKLHTDRRLKPKQNIAAGSLGIGGQQTCVIPTVSASGWWIIGWTPFEFYNLTKNNPCLVKPGDYLKFKPISTKQIAEYKEEGKRIWEMRD